MADTHDTRLRWERRRAGSYRAQATHENGTVAYALERVGRSWLLVAHEATEERVIATDLRTMREGRDLAQRVTDLRAQHEAQERAQAQAQRRSKAQAQWRSKAQAWMSSECSTCEDTSRLWECAPCSCGSDTQAQAQAQRRSKAQAQRTEWRNGARLTWRPFASLAQAMAQARVSQ